MIVKLLSGGQNNTFSLVAFSGLVKYSSIKSTRFTIVNKHIANDRNGTSDPDRQNKKEKVDTTFGNHDMI